MNVFDGLRLTAVLQPVAAAASGQVVGFEALCRPFRGGVAVDPGALFSASAERTSVRRLDIAAQSVAVRAARGVLGDGLLFVNVSASTLTGRWGWLSSLAADAEATGLRARQVVLEVTEQHRPDERRLGQLRERATDLGLQLALDDLGEGHATMATLDALQPEYVKLAPWAARVCRGPALAGVIADVVADCHGRGMVVVAEGVEEAAQHDALTALGVDLLQGYFIGRPRATAAAA